MTKVPVSERNIMRRLNHLLKRENQQIRKAIPGFADLGRYYMIDTTKNMVIEQDLDLTALGRKHNLLKPWEEVA